MPQREPRKARASKHVTVFKDDGTPVQYPKGQIHRIEDSKILHLVSPAAVEIEPEVSFPAPTGGGWYELSDGTAVQGKGNARDQQKELDS